MDLWHPLPGISSASGCGRHNMEIISPELEDQGNRDPWQIRKTVPYRQQLLTKIGHGGSKGIHINAVHNPKIIGSCVAHWGRSPS
jgi:hypothetical protein